MLKNKWIIAFIITAAAVLFAYAGGGNPSSALTLNDGVSDLGFMSQLEKDVVRELNLARSNPRRYADFVEEFKKHYAGVYIYVAGQIPIKTREGASAVNEAIDFLKMQQPVRMLRVSRGLCRSARVHVVDQGPTGGMSHAGTDNSTPDQRMNRFGKVGAAFGEVIEYGNWSARQIVMQLIINDGVPDRSHRKNIFKPFFNIVGVSYGPHRRFGSMCVINFAGSFTEGDDD